MKQILNSNISIALDEELSNDLQMIIDKHKVIEKDEFIGISFGNSSHLLNHVDTINS